MDFSAPAGSLGTRVDKVLLLLYCLTSSLAQGYGHATKMVLNSNGSASSRV